MWNQKDQVRAAKKQWMQRSLAVLRKEQKRVWNLVKDPINCQVISSLMPLLCFFVCLCACAHTCMCVYACVCLSFFPWLSVSLLGFQFLPHTLPSSCSPVPFRPLFSPNLPFQVAEKADKRSVLDQERCHLSESLSGDKNKWYLPKSY